VCIIIIIVVVVTPILRLAPVTGTNISPSSKAFIIISTPIHSITCWRLSATHSPSV